MGGAVGTRGRKEWCIHGFGWETCSKETAWNTQM